MKYIVFITINNKSKINGLKRIYVGVHQTEHPDMFDGYLGNGVYANQFASFKYPKTPFQCAVKKYGADAFERITLFIYDNEQDAYNKVSEILTEDFTIQDHVYNMEITDNIPINQFDIKGKLVKKWNSVRDASNFYGYPSSKFITSANSKCTLVDSFWSVKDSINTKEYIPKPNSHYTYIYSLSGKLLREFSTQFKCAEFLNCTKEDIAFAIKSQIPIGKYYVSNKVTDEFKAKPRRAGINRTYYVYKESGEFVGKFIGKKVMNAIKLHSWAKIQNIFSYNNNWYKDFYISLEPIDKVPLKIKNFKLDVFDKYGNFIESLSSPKEAREKYNITPSRLKNIRLGDRYFDDYIFKYSK